MALSVSLFIIIPVCLCVSRVFSHKDRTCHVESELILFQYDYVLTNCVSNGPVTK